MAFAPPQHPEIVTAPPRGPVLVIAPHPDDEIMGPGGTLMLHARAGDPISVVVVCDGANGDPDALFPRDGYVERREAETRVVARSFLGTDAVRFFRFPDGLGEGDIDKVYPGLPTEPEAKRRALVDGLATHLLACVQETAPRTVYYPWSGELHADHWGTGTAVENLVNNHPELFGAVSVLGYEVWSTLLPDTLVDITSVMAEKRAAIRSYETQVRYTDYATVVGGLNHHRGVLTMRRGEVYAEAFCGRYKRADA